MKVKLFSIAVSLLFFPVSLIGNLLGGAAVEIQVWLNNFFLSPYSIYGIPDWIKYPLGSIFAGIAIHIKERKTMVRAVIMVEIAMK